MKNIKEGLEPFTRTDKKISITKTTIDIIDSQLKDQRNTAIFFAVCSAIMLPSSIIMLIMQNYFLAIADILICAFDSVLCVNAVKMYKTLQKDKEKFEAIQKQLLDIKELEHQKYIEACEQKSQELEDMATKIDQIANKLYNSTATNDTIISNNSDNAQTENIENRPAQNSQTEDVKNEHIQNTQLEIDNSFNYEQEL